jgi:hypothetical protein
MRTLRSRPWLAGGFLTLFLAVPEARADDCARVVDAYAKGAREKRSAVLDVKDPHQGTGEAIRVWTPTAHYQTDLKGGYTRTPPGSNTLAETGDAIRAGVKSGKTKCKVVGPDTYAGRKVTKIHFNDPSVPDLISAQTVWVDDATGLPMFMALDGVTEGFGWQYGDAVKVPAGVH